MSIAQDKQFNNKILKFPKANKGLFSKPKNKRKKIKPENKLGKLKCPYQTQILFT